jgi:hypothetical protein
MGMAMAEPRFSYTDQVKTPYNSIAGRPLAKAEIDGEKTNYYYDPKATDFYIPLDPNLLDLTSLIQANPPSAILSRVWLSRVRVVRVKSMYQGEVRGWHRWTYTSETPIGKRIQKGQPDVPLNEIEIKGKFRKDGTFEYHLDPRTKPAQ